MLSLHVAFKGTYNLCDILTKGVSGNIVVVVTVLAIRIIVKISWDLYHFSKHGHEGHT